MPKWHVDKGNAWSGGTEAEWAVGHGYCRMHVPSDTLIHIIACFRTKSNKITRWQDKTPLQAQCCRQHTRPYPWLRVSEAGKPCASISSEGQGPAILCSFYLPLQPCSGQSCSDSVPKNMVIVLSGDEGKGNHIDSPQAWLFSRLGFRICTSKYQWRMILYCSAQPGYENVLISSYLNFVSFSKVKPFSQQLQVTLIVLVMSQTFTSPGFSHSVSFNTCNNLLRWVLGIVIILILRYENAKVQRS